MWWMSVPQCQIAGSRVVDTSICEWKYWNDVKCRLTGWMLWPQWGRDILFKIEGGIRVVWHYYLDMAHRRAGSGGLVNSKT